MTTGRDTPLREYGGIYLRGVLMGAADIVPGVSGGTIAFITGIYDRLIAAISAVDHRVAMLILRGQWRAAVTAVDGGFLLALLLGIGTSVASLAHLISWLLAVYPLLVWAFFFGLIAGSALVLVRHVSHWQLATGTALVGGVLVAAGIALSPATQLGEGNLALFAAGFVAICAMILPGISGSFILVLLGMYGPVLAAVEGFDVLALGILGAGAVFGLLLFSRLLDWLLTHFHAACMALLTGFLVGSLLVVWPWKAARDTDVGGVVAQGGALQWPMSPGTFTGLTGEPAQVLSCVLLMLAGLAAVLLIERRWGDDGP